MFVTSAFVLGWDWRASYRFCWEFNWHELLWLGRNSVPTNEYNSETLEEV
jgi:hypothetical protein